MEQADAQAGKGSGAQFLIHFHGGFELGLRACGDVICSFRKQFRGFALPHRLAHRGGRFWSGLGIVVAEIELGLVAVFSFNDGIDDVGLAALGDLLSDEVPRLGGALASLGATTLGGDA